MIRAFALCGGYLDLPYESMIRDAPPSRWTVPIECFLVEHPRGRLLFDTGLHCDTLTKMRERYGEERARRFGVRGGRFNPRGAHEIFVELLHLEDQARRLVADRAPHLLEELHAFALVLDLGIDLSIADQPHTAPQAVHDEQMVLPGSIDDLQ